MDGSSQHQQQRASVDEGLREIRAHMPDTYRAIQRKAAEVGNEAYAWVRRALAGQPDLFYAIERGRVVGTPFATSGIAADVAAVMVQFNCKSVVMWAFPAPAGGEHGPQ